MTLRLSNSLWRNAALCAALSLWVSAFWVNPIWASPQAKTKEPPKIPDGAGKDAVIKVCGNCHGVEIAVSRRESKEGWNGVVDDMIQRGAQGTDDEFGDIVDYLATNFSKSTPGGKVNVNSATAKELVSGVGFSDEQAAAIIRYRDEKGKFKSVADLAKVPGLDAAAIESKKSKLAF
jgi:competence protein ComEA